MKRLLLVRLSAMGDLVQSLGAGRALAAARPELELHFVVQAQFGPLLMHLDWIRSVVPHDRSTGLVGLWRTRRQLRRLGLDAALDLQGNWKSAVIARLSGAGLRIGAAAPRRQEGASHMLLNRRVTWEGAPHPARMALEVVRALVPEAEDLGPKLVASAAEVEAAKAAVIVAGVDPSRPFSLLVVGSPEDLRSWPLAAMRRQEQEESEKGPVLWLLGPGEEGVVLPPDRAQIRHQPGELRELVGLGAVVAGAGGRVLGPDRGATHVLAACGAETLALCGPQDPACTAPKESRALVKRAGPDCVPCKRRRCDHPEGPVCMDFTLKDSRPARPRPLRRL